MTKITFLGGCREVGRSAVLIESNSGNKIMLDYGVRFSQDERLPQEADLSNLKAVALSHCHVDHSGALPHLYKGVDIPLLTNPVTLALIELLIKDTIKISSYPYDFGYRELNRMLRNAVFLENNHSKHIGEDFVITFYNAGHVPGSVSILVEVDDKRILYTGDVNTIETRLVEPSDPSSIPQIDAIIIESTYALREHPDRKQIEKEFVEKVMEVNESGGVVLVPAFGVARSQEAFLILNKHGFNRKIFVDGMTRNVSKLFAKYPKSIKNEKDYKSALKRINYVYKRKDKNKALNSNGVIISPSGMLKGGSALKYIKRVLNDPDSGIYLVGYQVEGTPGHGLLENDLFEFEDRRPHARNTAPMKIKAKCDTDYFDFSSHGDIKALHGYIDALEFNGGKKLAFCVHGDNKSVTKFSKELSEKGFISVAPETGEVYTL